ncbi:unnamed protein product [Lactuca saligna]|uniref:Uncharacterized protein n=1 Tax=Lactuca saligna TaxID=75948 RepID=A0AA35VM21_LACSI|nr:unnamed protein product [Lactuca saligna]
MANHSRNLDYEITKLREASKERHELFMQQVDVVGNETTRLIKHITAFNNDCLKDLKVKTDKDDNVFEKVEEFLSYFKKTLLKVNISTQSSIYQDSIFTMVSNIESSIKAELASILNLVLLLKTNVPLPMHISQGGDKVLVLVRLRDLEKIQG